MEKTGYTIASLNGALSPPGLLAWEGSEEPDDTFPQCLRKGMIWRQGLWSRDAGG